MSAGEILTSAVDSHIQVAEADGHSREYDRRVHLRTTTCWDLDCKQRRRVRRKRKLKPSQPVTLLIWKMFSVVKRITSPRCGMKRLPTAFNGLTGSSAEAFDSFRPVETLLEPSGNNLLMLNTGMCLFILYNQIN